MAALSRQVTLRLKPGGNSLIISVLTVGSHPAVRDKTRRNTLDILFSDRLLRGNDKMNTLSDVLDLQRLTGELWIAGAEDFVRFMLQVEFLLQDSFNVDLGEHSKAFLL